MTAPSGLFVRLLGRDFDALAPAVQAVHCGRSLTLQGHADVMRGRGLLARLLCTCARLAHTQVHAPTRVEISVRGEEEVWRRHFGASPVMQSRFRIRRGRLRERFGPAVLEFALAAEAGGVSWRPERASVFGLPIPRAWLADMAARAFERGGRYYFEVRVALPRVGTVIEYRGQLQADLRPQAFPHEAASRSRIAAAPPGFPPG